MIYLTGLNEIHHSKQIEIYVKNNCAYSVVCDTSDTTEIFFSQSNSLTFSSQ